LITKSTKNLENCTSFNTILLGDSNQPTTWLPEEKSIFNIMHGITLYKIKIKLNILAGSISDVLEISVILQKTENLIIKLTLKRGIIRLEFGTI
jgi:hypothetical protein